MTEKDIPYLRAKIINSVFNDGLKSGALLEKQDKWFLKSADHFFTDEVCGVEIRPPIVNNVSLPRWLHINLYNNAYCLMPVLAERVWGHNPVSLFPPPKRRFIPLPDQVKSILEQRIKSSFVVVCSTDKKYKPMSEISPDIFETVIFPDQIWKEYQSIREDCSGSFRVVTISRMIKRHIGWHQSLLNVPNYEKQLLFLLKQSQPGSGIWVHGVRLPTEQDLELINKQPCI